MRKEARRAIFQCERMADCLNDIAAQRHAELGVVVDRISERIVRELEQHARGDVTSLTLPLSEVDASMAYSVGGKNANLGELRNMLDMPVPPGFAVTIRASALFLRHEDLMRRIRTTLCAVDAEDPASIPRGLPKPCRSLYWARLFLMTWSRPWPLPGRKPSEHAKTRWRPCAPAPWPKTACSRLPGNISQSWASRGKRCPRPSKKWWPVSFPRAP